MKRTLGSWLLMAILLAGCKDTSGPRHGSPPPNAGTMRIQINGKLTHDSTWSSYGQFRDILAADTGELSLLGGQSASTIVSRSMTVVFPGRLDVGSFSIGRYVYGEIPNHPAAFVVIDSSFYASIPGGAINITSDSYPPRPGLEPGRMSGGLLFHAVRLTDGPGGTVIETTDTIAVTATFTAHWYHYLRPNVALTVTGGPVPGSSLVTISQSVDDDHGGRFVSWDADFDRVPQGIPYEVSEELRVAAPAVGTYTLGQMTPVRYADPAQWLTVYSALFYRDDPRLALTAGGTLTIAKFVAPTDAYFGEIQGTLDAPLALWSDDTTVTADTAHVSAIFAVPIPPLGGIPASHILSLDHQEFALPQLRH